MTALEKGDSFEVTVKVVKETRNNYRCEEIGADQQPVDFKDALVGTVYLKKSLFETPPTILSVSVRFER